MALRWFCDNCNAECQPRTVVISWSEWSDMSYPQRKIHGLCEDCALMLATLDFGHFVEAHDNRPTSFRLP